MSVMADRPEVPPLRLEARRAEESPAASGPIERDANILRALEEANAGMEESRAPGAGEISKRCKRRCKAFAKPGASRLLHRLVLVQ